MQELQKFKNLTYFKANDMSEEIEKPELEERYIVIKKNDLTTTQFYALFDFIQSQQIKTRASVVCEEDWAPYKQVVELIKEYVIPEVRYHEMSSCNKCGSLANNVYPQSMASEGTIECAKTECKKCGHNDVWEYGFFESAADIGVNCDTYTNSSLNLSSSEIIKDCDFCGNDRFTALYCCTGNDCGWRVSTKTFKAKAGDIVHLDTIYGWLGLIPVECYQNVGIDGMPDDEGDEVQFFESVEIKAAIKIGGVASE